MNYFIFFKYPKNITYNNKIRTQLIVEYSLSSSLTIHLRCQTLELTSVSGGPRRIIGHVHKGMQPTWSQAGREKRGRADCFGAPRPACASASVPVRAAPSSPSSVAAEPPLRAHTATHAPYQSPLHLSIKLSDSERKF
jgi:hypothetical protein